MWTIEKYDELTSTNDIARERVTAGVAPNGLVIQTDHQSAGRGRLPGRQWSDERGKSLLTTVVLTDVPRVFVELAPYVAALSAAYSVRTILQSIIQFFDPSRIRIKWPNDVHLDGKKFCGVLSEAVWSGNTVRALLLGMGANVNQDRFDDRLRHSATSLYSITRRTLNVDIIRDQLLAGLASFIDRARVMPELQFRASVLSELRLELGWMKLLPPFDVELNTGEIVRMVRFAGLEQDGGMRVEPVDGGAVVLYSGTLLHGDSAERIAKAM